MVNRDESGIGDDVERLLAAIVGMRAPADVGQEAGGVTQPPLVRGLVEARGGHEAVGPGDQFLAVRGRARAQDVELAGGGHQRVLAALLAVEHRIEQALAHPKRRDHDILRLRDFDQVLEHERGIGEQWTPRVGDHLDLRQRFRADPVHQAREIIGLPGRDDVAVHDVQGIALLPHVQPCERAPSAADRVKGAADAGFEQAGAIERLLDHPLGLFDRLRGDVLERKPAERERDAGVDAVPMDIGEFERTAAEVADDAVGFVEAGDDAKRRQFRLAFARDHLDLGAADALGFDNEGLAVPGVAASGGRDCKALRDIDPVT